MESFLFETLPSLACELPDEVQKYKLCGDFEAAQRAIERYLSRPLGKALKERLRLEQTHLRQLALEYPYTQEQTCVLMREQVPDFSAEDLRRLDEDGLAEWMMIDGEKRYIHSIVRNVMLKDDEMIRRAGKDPEDKTLLKKTVCEMMEQGELTWRFRVRTSIRLKDEHFYPGIFLRVHLPIPAKLHQITQVKILAHSEADTVLVDGEEAPYRMICFKSVLQENREFFVEYEYTVHAVYHDFSEEDEMRAARVFDGKTAEEIGFVEEEYPHMQFTPYLRRLAREIVGGERKPLLMARKIYDYITTNVKYSLVRDYFLIPDIPQYCAANLRGDCGVQALLFITLLRICGIPAKWQSGLNAPPDSVGPHDWAMFWIAPYGWLYADPSFGGSAYHDGDETRRNFYFGNLDPFRMVANNAFGHTFEGKKKFLPIDPWDNQSGEMESDRRGYGKREVETTKTMLSAQPVKGDQV